MAKSHWKAVIWIGTHRWGLLIPTAAFCACVLLLVRLLIPGGQTAEPASEGSEVLPDETEFYPEQEADIPTPDTGIYLAFNPYVTHENADGQTMLEQATLVNLYTDDSGMLRGQVYEYLKQDSPVAGIGPARRTGILSFQSILMKLRYGERRISRLGTRLPPSTGLRVPSFSTMRRHRRQNPPMVP